MTWMIKDEQGNEINGVLSFRIDQLKEKPATLSWTMMDSKSFVSKVVSVCRGSDCVFKGKIYPCPTSFVKGDRTWIVVAMDDTYQDQKAKVLSELHQSSLLTGKVKDCEGAKAGYIYVDPVTHAVSWVSLEKPNAVWDAKGLHERDSLHIIPIDQPLKGVSASVTLKEKRLQSGMMDVGPFIADLFPHGIETYSGVTLEEQWTKFAFRAVRAGYDIHQAELVPITYQRADLPKRFSMLNHKDELVGIPYQVYAVKLLLGWAVPVTTCTRVMVETENAYESFSLSLKDESSVDENAVVKEIIQWMKAYVITRSFTAQVKYRVFITDDIPVTTLGVNAWGYLQDLRIRTSPIQGPIVGYTLSNEGGVTWADITLLWAPITSLQIAETAGLVATEGAPITIGSSPNDIIESVKMINGANDQHDYYLRHQSNTFETFAKDFPMTQIEIGLHPVTYDTTEYLERRYKLELLK